MKIRYLPEALAEYEAAATWYDEQGPGSGDNFVAAIERAERVIATMPGTWPQWPGARSGTRRYLVPNFMFSIAYRHRGDEVVILAVAHPRRRPGYWFERDDE